jgi:hypothetical protein
LRLFVQDANTCELKLTDSLSVVFAYSEPPFHSSLRLMQNEKRISGVFFPSNLAHDILRYISKNIANLDTPESFAAQLKSWQFQEFAMHVEDAMKPHNISHSLT